VSGSVLEAMAAGTVVVAAPAPGMQELLGDGAGMITPERTPAAFAAAVQNLATPERRAPLVESARERVVARYSLDSVADQLAALYRELAPAAAPAGEVSAHAA
jgi:glycosyltransferase involved in cell wall biosynthesis